MVKNPPADTADTGSIPRSGRSPGVGNGNPLQDPCLENSMNRETWWATVHTATESDMTEHREYVHVCGSVCLTLCDPMNYSLPGSVHEILQARILEWVAISYSRGSSWPRDWTSNSYISCVGRQALYHQHQLGRLQRVQCQPLATSATGRPRNTQPSGRSGTSPFLCKSLLEPFNPWFLQMNLCLPNTTQNFFPGWDSARYQARSDRTFIFRLCRALLSGKLCTLLGMILFLIESQILQPPSTWRKKHSRQRRELGADSGPLAGVRGHQSRQKCAPMSLLLKGSPGISLGSLAVSKGMWCRRNMHSLAIPHSLMPWNRNKPQNRLPVPSLLNKHFIWKDVTLAENWIDAHR